MRVWLSETPVKVIDPLSTESDAVTSLKYTFVPEILSIRPPVNIVAFLVPAGFVSESAVKVPLLSGRFRLYLNLVLVVASATKVPL